jgi:hypothetical protein
VRSTTSFTIRLMFAAESADDRAGESLHGPKAVAAAIAATLFGYHAFMLREISPETVLAAAPACR